MPVLDFWLLHLGRCHFRVCDREQPDGRLNALAGRRIIEQLHPDLEFAGDGFDLHPSNTSASSAPNKLGAAASFLGSGFGAGLAASTFFAGLATFALLFVDAFASFA